MTQLKLNRYHVTILFSAFVQSECIRARELRSWVDLLPNAHVTLLIDTHQSTVARYGMRRAPEVAEIMDDPWGELIGPHSTSVVYYLKPDPTAIAHQMGITQEKKEEGEELGMLTECFVSALLNCCKRCKFLMQKRCTLLVIKC